MDDWNILEIPQDTLLGQGPVYFNCYPNKTVSRMDRNILNSLFLNIHFHGLDMKERLIPAALIYRIQYKVMNTCASRVLLKPQRGETTLFITDMTKVNVSLPRTIKWDEQMKDGELIQSELPPTTQYQLPNVKDSNNKLVMAIPFKTKDVNEEATSKDIKSLMEQANYTNKYLQVFGESIKTKVIPKHKTIEEASTSIPIEKPLFKPFKISDKAKRKIRELRKNKSLIEGVGDNNSELLNKIDSLLKVIPETPQTLENTSKMVTRSTSKLINVINEDSDQNSENTTKIGSVSEKDINPINSKHWKTPSKLYYQRTTAPDLLLEERGEKNFKSFSANNIYEWNIDAQTEYNIMNTLQHMTMVATTYKTSHECSEETIIDILVAGFFEQLKGWWYRDTFLTRVYTKEDTGLPRSLGDKVRDKTRSQSANGDIPYESLRYGQLISYVQKVALKICQVDKIQRQLAKEKAQTKKELGYFCEQFGLPACPKQKKKQTSRKEIHENKPVHKKRFPRRRYSHKPSTSHINKYCRLKKKLRNLKLEPAIEDQINNLLIETSEEETETSSSMLSDENLNMVQQDDQLSSTDDDGQINTLIREQDLLKRRFSGKTKENVREINNLKREVRELRQQQEIHQIILSHLEESSDSENTETDNENEIENLEDEMFMGLINKIKIQKFYINIRIIINDFVLDTMALFDIGTNSKCILEGLIPTKFFEKTSNKLSTANGSKLKINFKLSNAIIENQGLRINTNFLLHWNSAQEKYSTVKKEVLAIVLCISKLQSDLLNQKFLIRVDCKSAKDILQKDVKNLASKQIFARCQAILSVFDFEIEYIKSTSNSLPDYLAKNSSGGGGRSSKGTILALPEPNTKKASSTFSGSSTQKSKLEESSTQDSPKPITTKQIVANYVWSIQTLQALKEMGLTKVLRLAKKTWAEMASKSDDDSEIELQKQIQIAKKTKTVNNPEGKQTMVQQDPTPKPANSYVSKNIFFFVLQMESEYWDKNPFKATAKAFLQGFHYKPTSLNKTRKFYEFILVDTNSVSIKHFKDSKDPNPNTHSTIQILKANPKFLKPADPKTLLFLNQKSQLVAFLASSKSKESLAKNLKEVLHLLQQEEESITKKEVESPEENDDQDDNPFYQNEDYCFGISLEDD
ncbi:hypothetical protein JHK82_018514 [Glycine max]|nr:hypothetical protein JHK86_018543 [Glycine max]KAG5142819.1 hypothetical protein JHK82_018514 [Glycine max]